MIDTGVHGQRLAILCRKHLAFLLAKKGGSAKPKGQSPGFVLCMQIAAQKCEGYRICEVLCSRYRKNNGLRTVIAVKRAFLVGQTMTKTRDSTDCGAFLFGLVWSRRLCAQSDWKVRNQTCGGSFFGTVERKYKYHCRMTRLDAGRIRR